MISGDKKTLTVISSSPHEPSVASRAVDGQTWAFEEGTEISPGRHAVRLLGGGRRYEAYLAWDDDLYTLVVAKILRPHVAGDPIAKGAVEREAAALAALAADLRRRDGIDTTRRAAPLRIPGGAIVIRTEHNTLEQTVDEVVALIEQVAARG